VLVGLRLHRGLAHGGVGSFAVAREIDARGRWWYLALGLEKSGLEVDDVVTELIVLGLERLVKFA
jgi:hypothetical protein